MNDKYWEEEIETMPREELHKLQLRRLRKTIGIYNPQIEMFARFKMKSSFHKTKRII